MSNVTKKFQPKFRCYTVENIKDLGVFLQVNLKQGFSPNKIIRFWFKRDAALQLALADRIYIETATGKPICVIDGGMLNATNRA
jgi:hypothetical protein